MYMNRQIMPCVLIHDYSFGAAMIDAVGCVWLW